MHLFQFRKMTYISSSNMFCKSSFIRLIHWVLYYYPKTVQSNCYTKLCWVPIMFANGIFTFNKYQSCDIICFTNPSPMAVKVQSAVCHLLIGHKMMSTTCKNCPHSTSRCFYLTYEIIIEFFLNGGISKVARPPWYFNTNLKRLVFKKRVPEAGILKICGLQ